MRLIVAVLLALALAVGAFAVNVAFGMHAHARYDGAVEGLTLHAPVTVLRDNRGVPHIVARDNRDLFFAQGYVEGSDRLFQMEMLRRSILGQLAEVFGAADLEADMQARAVPVRAIANAQWKRADFSTREALEAFSDGVNAAMEREPLPVEFRLLAYRPRPWTPHDSLAVEMAFVLDVIDDWNAVASRDAAYTHGGLKMFDEQFELTDPCYDAPVLAGLQGMAPGPRCKRDRDLIAELRGTRTPNGSNAWAVGAACSLSGRSLLANDPHLGLAIPGYWYAIDLHSPGYHVAGASLPGLPGVVLGHNEHVAWGATAGSVTSLSAFSPPPHLDAADWQTERFAVRLRPNATARYYRGHREFGLTTQDHRFVLVRWTAYDTPSAFVQTVLALDRASSIESATTALASFSEPALNFVLADTKRAAYVLAGKIPNDPVRARWFHSASDLARSYAPIPYALLPKIPPSRSAIVWTANNKMYDSRYPLALSPQFAPPYRAYRIAQLLRARQLYDVPYFERMQMDALSLPERELARELATIVRPQNASLADALAGWDGELNGDSTTATLVVRLRTQLAYGVADRQGRIPMLFSTAQNMRALPPWIVVPSPTPWSDAGAAPTLHSLAKLHFLNGVTLPGYGDAFTLHMQFPVPPYSQSFRSVWDVGNWDAGGLSLPQGESGEPGSDHYTDEASAWIAGRLLPLPFSGAAVQRSAIHRETLLP